MSAKDKSDIETYIQAAYDHGADSDPDHEVGDLQDMLRQAWKLMTPEQKDELVNSQACKDVLWVAYMDDEEDEEPADE